MSGAGTPSTTQSMTGDLKIDGILTGSKWNASSISYSNPDSVTDYQVGYSSLTGGFEQINSSQLIALQSALDSARYSGFAPAGAVFAVEGFTNLLVSPATAGSGAGTIRVANSTDYDTAFAYFPGASSESGDIFINKNVSSLGSPSAGNYGWHAMMHEVGRAIGLKHGNGGAYELPYYYNSLEFAIMSTKSYIGSSYETYTNGSYGYPQTFMQLDILALQTMYGANYNTNSTNTTYTWSTTDGTMSINGSVALDPGGSGLTGNKIFATIWDGNGIDTYDLSNFTTAVSIDLNPGAFSTIDTGRLADLGGGNYARGNIANALLFGGDTRSMIERANGGSGNDTLVGNAGGNRLEGNNGNDSLSGGGNGDYLLGGAGNDILDGGTGDDSMDGGTGDDTFYVDSFFDQLSELSGQGTDKVYASVSYNLVDLNGYIEQVILTGSANINTKGNSYGVYIPA